MKQYKYNVHPAKRLTLIKELMTRVLSDLDQVADIMDDDVIDVVNESEESKTKLIEFFEHVRYYEQECLKQIAKIKR